MYACVLPPFKEFATRGRTIMRNNKGSWDSSRCTTQHSRPVPIEAITRREKGGATHSSIRMYEEGEGCIEEKQK